MEIRRDFAEWAILDFIKALLTVNDITTFTYNVRFILTLYT
jgi:hypothetical protein